MRLICPNCDAQYEVSDDVIPTEGRDVQCSNCGQTWFQYHPDHLPVAEEVDELPPDLQDPFDTPEEDEERVAFEPPPPPLENDTDPNPLERRPLDEGVADILREEAELEQRARAAQAIETQPDLGLDTAESETDRRAREARERMARLRGEDPNPVEAAATAAAVGSRKELLPDIEEINSTLRASDSKNTRAADIDDLTEVPKRRRGGFRSGFMLMVVLALGLGILYVFAPQIAQTVPQTDPYISNYVTIIDQARVWLDTQLQNGLSWLDNVAAEEG